MTLLDRLRAPKQSELGRKRKVAMNLPSNRTIRKAPKTYANPKKVNAQQRVREFPGQSLKVSAGKLFCIACHEEVGLKKSIISRHMTSVKHINGKMKLADEVKREKDRVDSLHAYDLEVHPKGQTLPYEQRVHRVKVLTAFLCAGIPLNKLSCFADILEENAFSLGGRQNMSDLTPFIPQNKKCCIKCEISRRAVSVIFDGTTRLGEAMCVILWYVDDNWKIEQHLVRFLLISHSMTGEEVARELLTLSTELGITSQYLLATMRDRVSVNNVAVRTLQVMYPDALDV